MRTPHPTLAVLIGAELNVPRAAGSEFDRPITLVLCEPAFSARCCFIGAELNVPRAVGSGFGNPVPPLADAYYWRGTERPARRRIGVR